MQLISKADFVLSPDFRKDNYLNSPNELLNQSIPLKQQQQENQQKTT